MIQINDIIAISEDELQYTALYSTGPGGQHVNKNMTAIQLRFNIIQCQTLPYVVKQKLIQLGGSRVNSNFEIVITARRHRSQERNKRDALERFCILVRKSAERRKPRKKKRPSHAANQSRLEQKRRCSEMKTMRRRVKFSSE